MEGLDLKSLVMVDINGKYTIAKVEKINRETEVVTVKLDGKSGKKIEVFYHQISFIKDDNPSFSINQDYLYTNNGDDEESNMRHYVEKGFRKFLRKFFDQYPYLREINLDNVIIGDYCCFPECYDEVEIMEIDEETDIFTVRLNDKSFQIPKMKLKPIENRIQKLKKHDIKFLYEFIESEIPMEMYDYEIFTSVFVNFFRINAKNLSFLVD